MRVAQAQNTGLTELDFTHFGKSLLIGLTLALGEVKEHVELLGVVAVHVELLGVVGEQSPLKFNEAP